MKKRTIFKEPVLISQDEMANLLAVTRSQWAMYSTGQRGLSAEGKVKLEQLITSANQVSFFKKEKLVQETVQEEERQKQLLNWQKDNKLKQLKLQRKIKSTEEKYETALNTLYLLNTLQDKRSKINVNESILNVLQNKANKILSSNGLKQQDLLKIKLEVLIYEENLLKNRYQKLQ